MMTRISTRTLLLTATFALFTSEALAAGFTPGNLILNRIGDGSAVPTSNTAPVFLDEYTPAGVLVQSVALPFTPAGGTVPATGNLNLTESGTAGSDGQINLSVDGRYVTVTGYNSPLGVKATGTIPDAPAPGGSSANARVVGLVDVATGQYNTSTALGTYYSGNNIRDAATVDGTNFYTAGANKASTLIPGIAYAGANVNANPTGISTGDTSIRAVTIYNNNLYYSNATGVYRLPDATTNGLPTPGTQGTPVQLAGTAANSPAGTTLDPYDFLFQGNALYVATIASATIPTDLTGIQKYITTDNGLTYSYAYALGSGNNVEGLTGSLSANGLSENLYGTVNGTVVSVNDLLANTDTTVAGGETVSTLITVANVKFDGIRALPAATVVAPEPSSLLVTLIGMSTLGLFLARRRLRPLA